MKPVVSSIVALAIALSPAFALAAEKTQKPASAKVVKHHKKSIVQVHHKKDDKKLEIQKVHHVEGHKGEPKVEKGVVVIPASLTTKPRHGATAQVKPTELPKLPAPGASKAQKSGAEKGARKASEKKSSGESKDDGQPERDEDFANLVARIRGNSGAEVDAATEGQPSKAKLSRATLSGATHAAPKPPCAKPPVEIARGAEVEKFELTTCDGSVAPLTIERLSVLVRPGSAPRPTTTIDELAKKKGDLAHGIKRVDPGLPLRLQAIVDHFVKGGAPARIAIISGYRPASIGSLHASGRAIDFRLDGAKNEELVAFCKTLDDTGCGYYPNSSFVHVDVREPGAGHVSWIDASGPGETPRYVPVWPPPAASASASATEEPEPPKAKEGIENTSAKLDREAAPEPVDEHPAGADKADAKAETGAETGAQSGAETVE